jgi:two-component sensor histidine kinase
MELESDQRNEFIDLILNMTLELLKTQLWMRLFFVLALLSSTHFSFSQNDSVINLGKQLILENKLDEAISHYEKHLALTNESSERIRLLLDIGTVYKLKLDFDEAYDYYDKALQWIDKTENKELKFLYHVKMMEFYRKRGMYIEVIRHQEDAELLLRENTIREAYLASYYNRRAALFNQHFGIQDSIIKYAEKSLEISKRINDKDNIFYSTLEIASVYDTRKDYSRAIGYFEDLIKYAKQNHLVQHQADVLINYSNTLIKDDQLEKALEVSLEGFEFATKHELLYHQIILSINVYETYEKIGDHEKAYDYLLKRIVLTDRYNSLEHDKYLFELEEKYKLKEKENEIRISALELKNKNEALTSSNTKLLVTIGLLLIVALITVLIFFFLRKSKASNKKLTVLSQENEFLLSEANHRINNNLQLVVILITDQLKKSNQEGKLEIKNILTKVEAISTLHKHLYKNEDKDMINIKNYLNDIRLSFFEVFKDNQVTTHFNMESIKITSDNAMYMGLLLTELLINSIKHAFSSQDVKKIELSVQKKNSLLVFHYRDNGKRSLHKSIKPKLVDKICRQSDIPYTIDTSNGFSFSFQIALPK